MAQNLNTTEGYKTMNNLSKTTIAAVSLIALLATAGCTDAQIASSNLTTAAEQFELNRRIVFFNGITDTYLLSVEGLCSIEAQSREKQLEVTCKTGPDTFIKHHLGLSDNVSYFSEQIEAARVSTYHYRVIFKPQAIIPDIDAEGSLGG